MDLSRELNLKLNISKDIPLNTDDDMEKYIDKDDSSPILESPMSTNSVYEAINIDNNTSNMIDLLWIKNIKETFGKSVFICDFSIIFDYINKTAYVSDILSSNEHDLDEYIDYIKNIIKKNKNKVIVLSIILEDGIDRTNTICVINKEFTLEMFEMGGISNLENDIIITDMIMRFCNKLGLILCRPNKMLVQAGDKGYFTMFSYWYAMMRIKYKDINYNDFIKKINEKISSESIVEYIQKYILKLDNTASVIALSQHVTYDTFDNLYDMIYLKLHQIFGKYFD